MDAVRFAGLVDEARGTRPTDPAGADALLGAALDLWSGEAYGGLTDGCTVLAVATAQLLREAQHRQQAVAPVGGSASRAQPAG